MGPGFQRRCRAGYVRDGFEHTSTRSARCEDNADARGSLGDTGGDLEQPQAQRCEIDDGERCCFGNFLLDAPYHISHWAAVCNMRRIWLALAEWHEVRSLANWF